MSGREFRLEKAVRGKLPLFIGLCGASGSGKTYSALRLARGIQQVQGGDIAFIDTESGRALHYAEEFDFQHLELGAPFSPRDYWAAIEHCVRSGAKTIVVDSMSHEHEGPGGVLEMHASEVKRLTPIFGSAEKAQFAAWSEPKAQRRRLLNNIVQMRCNLILCFRAKRKVEFPKKGRSKAPIDMGWMPIAGEEFAYEMTALGVLPPGSEGTPDWSPSDPGSEMVTKRPSQFRAILQGQLTEDMGAAMAKWAMGAAQAPAMTPAQALQNALVAVDKCTTPSQLAAVLARATSSSALDEDGKREVVGAVAARKEDMESGE